MNLARVLALTLTGPDVPPRNPHHAGRLFPVHWNLDDFRPRHRRHVVNASETASVADCFGVQLRQVLGRIGHHAFTASDFLDACAGANMARVIAADHRRPRDAQRRNLDADVRRFSVMGSIVSRNGNRLKSVSRV